MPSRSYLPSAQFSLIALSLALSAGLVFAAGDLTSPTNTASVIVAAPSDSTNWQAALDAIQAANASSSIPQAPDQTTVQSLLTAAQSSNLTASIGKSILINLTSAEQQGMGDDIPTQDSIVAAAATQVETEQASPTTYTSADLTVVPVSTASLHTYGNEVIQALGRHPEASEAATLLAIDYIIEGGDKTKAAELATIGAAYAAAAQDLLTVPVPQTLVPLHLEVANNLSQLSATFADMQLIGSDPVRGLVALKTYEAFLDSGALVFTSIAQELNKDGILFTTDEPGSAWNMFLNPTGASGPSQ